MTKVQCPQCGAQFEREQVQFCPNPKCGYPVAFIDEPKSEPEEKVMVRRPGERVEGEEQIARQTGPPILPPSPAHHPSMHVYEVGEEPGSPRTRRWLLLAALAMAFLVMVVTLVMVLRGCSSAEVTSVTSTSAAGGVVETNAPSTGTEPIESASTGVTKPSEVRLAASIDSVPFYTSPAGDRVGLYFVRDGKIEPVQRRIDHAQAPATKVLEELLAGPSESEQEEGFSTGLPRGLALHVPLKIEDQVAYVDLSDGLPRTPVGLEWSNGLAQLVFALTQFEAVAAVAFRIEGAATPVLKPGAEPQPQVSRADFR